MNVDGLLCGGPIRGGGTGGGLLGGGVGGGLRRGGADAELLQLRLRIAAIVACNDFDGLPEVFIMPFVGGGTGGGLYGGGVGDSLCIGGVCAKLRGVLLLL